MRSTRSLAAAAAALLPAAALSTVAATTSPASAACAPSTVVAPHATAANHPHLSSSTSVSKVKRKHYSATIRITATQGAATVSLSQTLCPDGASGAATKTTQTGTGVGTQLKSVSGKGATKAAAKRAAKAKAARVIKRLKRTASTKRGKARAEARAIAAARQVAAAKARHVLYDASFLYLSPSDTAPDGIAQSSRPVRGGIVLRAAANGDLVVSIPAGAAGVLAAACIKRAPAWPTNFLFDAASVSSPQLAALAKHSGSAALIGVTVTGLTTGTFGQGSSAYIAEWESDGSHDAGVMTDGDSVVAGDAVCFQPELSSDAPAATVVLHGVRVGTRLGAADDHGFAHLVTGIPVTVG